MKSQLFRKLRALVVVSAVLAVTGACGEVTSVEDGMGAVKVTLQEASVDALFQVMTADFASAPNETAGRVPRDMVNSLFITVDGIQILPYCEEAGEENGDGQCEDPWETLELNDETYELNLLTLPLEDEPALVLVEGTEVPVGEYHKIRLFISEAKVSFVDEITVGKTTFLAVDNREDYVLEETSTWTTYDVEIPSAQNTGVKADINLEVTAETEGAVSLLFDAGATFRNVIATGNGHVKMPPVLKARPMNQHQNGG
jgi:hypothetical protein